MKKELTLASLFDGSGGFPQAAKINGIRPLWSSEIEPFPALVTYNVLDSLTHCGFWRDDSAVSFVSCEFGEVNKQGRTVVRISKGRKKYLLPAAKQPINEDW